MRSNSETTHMLVACDCGPVGNGRQIELAVTGLIADGHRVCVVLVSSGGGLATRLQAVGATAYVVNRGPTVRLSVTSRVAEIIRNEHPQTVVGWGIETAIIIASARVLTRHSWRYIQHVSEPLRTVLEAGIVARADEIIVTGESVVQASRGMESLQSISHIPPAAVAFDEMVGRDQLASQIGLDPSKQWTLCVAPLVSQSRIDRLIWGFDQMAVARNDV